MKGKNSEKKYMVVVQLVKPSLQPSKNFLTIQNIINISKKPFIFEETSLTVQNKSSNKDITTKVTNKRKHLCK